MLYRKLIEDNLSDRIILRTGAVACTYRELHRTAMALGECWHTQGLRIGDRVAVYNRNSFGTVAALLTCLAFGYAFVPVEPGNEAEAAHIIQDCSPEIIFDEEMLPIEDSAESHSRRLISPEAIGYIIYTSGSTNRSKGVVAPHHSIDFCMEAINKRLHNTEDDRILSRLPLSFDYGLYQILLSLRFGAELILLDSTVSLLKIPKFLMDNKITAFPVVPSLLRGLLNSRLLRRIQLPDLRYICSTGESLDPPLVARTLAELPYTAVIPMYGLTECKRVSVMPFGRPDKVAAGSCGLPLDGVSVTLDQVDGDTGIGELIIRGSNLMNGYFGDTQSTSEVFGVDENGIRYLRTGDLFAMDSEGFLYFKGRIKNLIKFRGKAVSGTAIEDFIRNIEGVRDVRVVGIADEIDGEKVCAFVFSLDRDINLKIQASCEDSPEYMRSMFIKVLNEQFPLNQNGKVDDGKLKMGIL